MSAKPQYKNPPASPMNQWVRDALEACGMSQKDMADELSRVLRLNYDKSIVQKMTVSRRIRMDEANAISAISNYPLPASDIDDDFAAAYRKLSKSNQETVQALVRGLLGAQEGPDKASK